ncbi:uncharacterized protein LOC116159880 [Photinus pyralis]|uniref:uncharacterized protein LOC116159880 n=1 Tax=Photinus pyralis TaxID=7054 RepID=UPI00126772CB|nr:uncharacterized protein LOC116159880 [Photinus pyralis]
MKSGLPSEFFASTLQQVFTLHPTIDEDNQEVEKEPGRIMGIKAMLRVSYQREKNRSSTKLPWFIRNDTLRADLANTTVKEHVRQSLTNTIQLNIELRKYNSTKHRTTGYKPIDVNEKNASSILKRVYSHINVINPKPPKFKVDDSVRISKYRTVFAKGYTPNWTYETFTVAKVKRSNPTTYILKDSTNQEIKGRFYEQELQKAQYPDIHLVERVIRRKGQKSLVKWLGFDSSHNSWVLNKDIL